MELKDAIERRTSVRQFKDEKIGMEKIREMVRLASHAPSVNNYQPWRFYAIARKELLQKMAAVVSRKITELPANVSKMSEQVKSQVEWFATFFQNAPVVIAVAIETYETILEKGVELSHEEINKMRNYPDIQSAGACIQNLLLAAVDMGYGACWLSAPMIAKGELEEMIGLKEPFHLIAFVAIGKPLTEPRPRTKRPVEEILEIIE